MGMLGDTGMGDAYEGRRVAVVHMGLHVTCAESSEMLHGI